MGKKGKFVALLATLLLVLQLPLLQATRARAQGGGEFPYVTSVRLVDPATGADLTQEQGIDKDAGVRVEYAWAIPDGASIESGDTYDFTVPAAIAMGSGTDLSLLDAGDPSAVVATIHIGSDGKGTATFTDYVKTHSDVHGTLNITSTFDSSSIGNTDPIKIPFTVNGETQYIPIDFQQPDAQNSKSGSYDAATGIVTWTVALNQNSTTVKGGHLTDEIAPGGDGGQTYVDGSFKVTTADGTVYDSSDGSGTGTFSYTPATTGDTEKTGTLDYAFAGELEVPATVTYQTRLADPSQYFGSSVTNTATFEHDGTSVDLPASVAVPKPDYVSKSGTYNKDTKNIDWTVTFNKDGLSLHDVKITDALPAGLTLVDGSVALDGGAVAPSSYTYEGGTLTYNAGDVSATHTLTFSTSLPDGYWLQNHGSNEFANSATMTSSDNSYLRGGTTGTAKGVSPTNSVVSKKSLGYDGETHEITWQVIVNASQQTLSDAYIRDTVSKGQEYEPGTFTISPAASNTLTGTQSFQVSGDPTNGTTLEYDFGTIGATYTITYKTQLVDPTAWAGNSSKTFVNDVWLYPNGKDGGNSSHGQGTQQVSPNVVAKAGSYDYTTHELTWVITVNASKVPLTGVVLADALTGNGLDDFDLETSTIQVDGTTLIASASSQPEVGTYHYDTSTKTLTVNLGDLDEADPTARVRTVSFKMKLNKTGDAYDDYFAKNGDRAIKNSASVTSTENPTPSISEGTVTIHNTVVGKTGEYTSGKAYIDWSVEINQNGIQLGDTTLTDTLPEGLELDTSSVALYPQTLSPDGSLSPTLGHDADGNIAVSGTPVALSRDDVSYDATTRKFTFTMPGGIADGTPYLLVFRTTIDPAHAGAKEFANSIALDGSKTSETSTSTPVETVFSSSDGTAYGKTADVTVTKTSSSGTPLAGAVFGLYDQYGNLIRVSSPTDAAGSCTFGHVNYATRYSVREISAPGDYTRSDASLSFTIDRSSKLIQLYSVDGQGTWTESGDPVAALPAFEDSLKTGSITLRKVEGQDVPFFASAQQATDSSTGQPLAGAGFTLYDGEGGEVASAVTGDDGTLALSGIPYGDYTLRETTTPEGYSAVDPIAISLHDSTASLSGGVLALGDVADERIPQGPAPTDGGGNATGGDATARVLPQTGDTSLDGIGWIVLGAAVAFGAAGTIRRLYGRR